MHQGKYIFSQIIGLISPTSFQTIVNRHNGEYKVKDFSCWKQFLCMAFGQLTHRESMTDTIICLNANPTKLYHLGIGNSVTLSTITRANEKRPYMIYQDLAMLLIEQAKQLYVNENNLEIELKDNIFAIDSTTIDLCLSAFKWANFRPTKAGIKLHTQLDLKTAIPEFILFTNANTHDVNFLDTISFQTNSIYIIDRAYVDYRRLYKIHLCGAFFVTRAKKNMCFKRLYSHPKDKKLGIIFDQTIVLTNPSSSIEYSDKIRLIKFKDETGKELIFMTNNFNLSASDIAQLYKHRWEIELFFKWIKQHLKIKSFWGQSENAVQTQVWIAVSVYVLIAIAKKRFMIKHSLYQIIQVLSVSIFDKMPVNQLFQSIQLQKQKEDHCNQLNIFDL